MKRILKGININSKLVDNKIELIVKGSSRDIILVYTATTDILPVFNNEFIDYRVESITTDDGSITKTILSSEKPTKISFKDCDTLTSVSYIDISNITNMNDMFYGCKSLTTLDVSNWDTEGWKCGRLMEFKDTVTVNTYLNKSNDFFESYAIWGSMIRLVNEPINRLD